MQSGGINGNHIPWDVVVIFAEPPSSGARKELRAGVGLGLGPREGLHVVVRLHVGG